MPTTDLPAPAVDVSPGRLPHTWDESGVFVANLLSLFFGNEKQTAELHRQVGRLESYGGRLVPIMGLLFRNCAENLIVLEQNPDPDLLDYFRTQLGLRLPAHHVLSHRDYLRFASNSPIHDPALLELVEKVRALPGNHLDGFVTDRALERMAELTGRHTISSHTSSRQGNNKVDLHRHLKSNGMPVFDTALVYSPAEMVDALDELRGRGYRRAAVKAQIGASGIGIMQVSTDRAPPRLPDYLFYEGPCLVQGWLDDQVDNISEVKSPSAQLFIHHESVSVYDLTDQILSDESVHQGNASPPQWLQDDTGTRRELLHQATIGARWLHATGYRGTASVDFHVVKRHGRREVRICEINARVTGATYPSLLARHLAPEGAWLMRNLQFSHPVPAPMLLDALGRHGRLFSPGDKANVLPINFNAQPGSAVVKGQFLCLGESLEETHDLLEEARHLLPVEHSYDRD